MVYGTLRGHGSHTVFGALATHGSLLFNGALRHARLRSHASVLLEKHGSHSHTVPTVSPAHSTATALLSSKARTIVTVLSMPSARSSITGVLDWCGSLACCGAPMGHG
jgi:hypothetical protein